MLFMPFFLSVRPISLVISLFSFLISLMSFAGPQLEEPRREVANASSQSAVQTELQDCSKLVKTLDLVRAKSIGLGGDSTGSAACGVEQRTENPRGPQRELAIVESSSKSNPLLSRIKKNIDESFVNSVLHEDLYALLAGIERHKENYRQERLELVDELVIPRLKEANAISVDKFLEPRTSAHDSKRDGGDLLTEAMLRVHLESAQGQPAEAVHGSLLKIIELFKAAKPKAREVSPTASLAIEHYLIELERIKKRHFSSLGGQSTLQPKKRQKTSR